MILILFTLSFDHRGSDFHGVLVWFKVGSLQHKRWFMKDDLFAASQNHLNIPGDLISKLSNDRVLFNVLVLNSLYIGILYLSLRKLLITPGFKFCRGTEGLFVV